VSQPEVIYRHEYVSGARLLRDVIATYTYVVNRGDSDHSARVLVYKLREQLMWDSVNASPIQGLGAVARPGEVWGPFMTPPLDFGIYWFRILVTSRELVPSVDFLARDADSRTVSSVDSLAPGDFSVFQLPFRIPRPGDSIEPGEVEPVLER
jgi:hypothetical protein